MNDHKNEGYLDGYMSKEALIGTPWAYRKGKQLWGWGADKATQMASDRIKKATQPAVESALNQAQSKIQSTINPYMKSLKGMAIGLGGAFAIPQIMNFMQMRKMNQNMQNMMKGTGQAGQKGQTGGQYGKALRPSWQKGPAAKPKQGGGMLGNIGSTLMNTFKKASDDRRDELKSILMEKQADWYNPATWFKKDTTEHVKGIVDDVVKPHMDKAEKMVGSADKIVGQAGDLMSDFMTKLQTEKSGIRRDMGLGLAGVGAAAAIPTLLMIIQSRRQHKEMMNQMKGLQRQDQVAEATEAEEFANAEGS